MIQREFEIQNKLGLHARAAAKFVKCASGFSCEVQVGKDAITVNGKSIIGVLLLAAPRGSRIVVMADGPDEAAAIAAIGDLIDGCFGEE